MWRSRRMVGIILTSSLLLSSTYARAQWAVIDASNLVQNTMTAINTARAVVQQATQIAHEVEMIKNQLDQLAYDAANLTALPVSLLQELTSAINSYYALLQQAQGLGYQLTQIGGAFDALYPQIGRSVVSSGTLTSNVQQWLGQVRGATRMAMQVQGVIERIIQQSRRIDVMIATSDAAPGHLAAQQATNQMLGIMAEQQASMQQILAASQRAHVSLLAAQAAEADAARAVADGWLAGYGTMVPVQGIGIPQFR